MYRYDILSTTHICSQPNALILGCLVAHWKEPIYKITTGCNVACCELVDWLFSACDTMYKSGLKEHVPVSQRRLTVHKPSYRWHHRWGFQASKVLVWWQCKPVALSLFRLDLKSTEIATLLSYGDPKKILRGPPWGSTPTGWNHWCKQYD